MSIPLLTLRCNPYGAETGGGVLLGGMSSATPERQWFCPERAEARYRMTCAHGHRGQVMPLCNTHARKFRTGTVQFCPPCNAIPPGHRCSLSLMEVS